MNRYDINLTQYETDFAELQVQAIRLCKLERMNEVDR